MSVGLFTNYAFRGFADTLAHTAAHEAGTSGGILFIPWGDFYISAPDADGHPRLDTVALGTYVRSFLDRWLAQDRPSLLTEIVLIVHAPASGGRPQPHPAHLAAASFADPLVLDQFRDFYDGLWKILLESASTTGRPERFVLAIGNEVDIHLSYSPLAWAQFRDFYEQAVEHVRKTTSHAPVSVSVGTSTRFIGNTGTVWHPYRGSEGWDPFLFEHIRDLNRVSDHLVLTYYPAVPVSDRWVLLPPEDASRHVARMRELNAAVRRRRPSGSAPPTIVLQEVGYPSSDRLPVAAVDGATMNSEQNQAAFVEALFDALANPSDTDDRIEAVFWWSLFDYGDPASTDPANRCMQLASLWNAQNSFWFKQVFCTTGLRRDDGSIKPAWTTFVRHSLSYAQP